ncbi:MAG: hypothetical protein A3G59_03100 [Candidatus Taylorbacteria bacterium RIFCSPLOWO2_12_FULL_47_20]|uniref:Penicillin-binding protein transpeptidase domain-containing protein n=2 Tax=Candidatus Tayloriibacteriota TaxID=1817919 RepID=A0A1G2PA38_9BACT|nr:MAG: hypothetical protein A3H68_01375 [Candidatus Taylorbacteria bacterium RIFCSPLOWO2_02_FULL_46_40]OHA45194.1 MAG: hypothetical protein A3G59_03100 [Candidatus Taylorbacteria bacterium RIFCSPLOWO2_12_FULL_47_20]
MSLTFFGRRKNKIGREIFPDEILIDSQNLPSFDKYRMQGRLETPISRVSLIIMGLIFGVVFLLFGVKAYSLQINNYEMYLARSEKNRLRHAPVFPQRGVISDRNGQSLVSNEENEEDMFFKRKYPDESGFGHLLGFVSYPGRDSSGFLYSTAIEGKDGAEARLNDLLQGELGQRLIEVDALEKISSESVLVPPRNGTSVKLSVDKRLQTDLYKAIKDVAVSSSFQGGAGVVLDAENGEILSMVSYPDYDSNLLSSGENSAAISSLVSDIRKPFLNRPTAGLYTPGSIVKLFVSIAALEENIISPAKQILSTGSISIPNPNDETKSTTFKDWKAHGYVDMRRAIAVSSNVYFYSVGGGYENQKGLGISKISEWMKKFGFGSEVSGFGAATGVVPNPDWKKEVFDGASWYLGDTYNTSIGQYGFQVTPLQEALAVGVIANGGRLFTPTLIAGEKAAYKNIPLDPKNVEVVREGMRMSVEDGTAVALNFDWLRVAGKTGTAQVGARNEYMNSWVVGFFPSDKPKYVFVVLMEKAPAGTLYGAPAAARTFFESIYYSAPEYVLK